MLISFQIRPEKRRVILSQPFPVFLRIGAISTLPGGQKDLISEVHAFNRNSKAVYKVILQTYYVKHTPVQVH